MKVIDLLNKIAKEQKVPEKIKFNDYEYLYHDKEHGYCRNDYDCTYICLDSEYYLFDILNDEVEIMEEKNIIPEKLGYFDLTKDEDEKDENGDDLELHYTGVADAFDDVYEKINEIIDKLNEMENNNE